MTVYGVAWAGGVSRYAVVLLRRRRRARRRAPRRRRARARSPCERASRALARARARSCGTSRQRRRSSSSAASSSSAPSRAPSAAVTSSWSTPSPSSRRSIRSAPQPSSAAAILGERARVAGVVEVPQAYAARRPPRRRLSGPTCPTFEVRGCTSVSRASHAGRGRPSASSTHAPIGRPATAGSRNATRLRPRRASPAGRRASSARSIGTTRSGPIPSAA